MECNARHKILVKAVVVGSVNGHGIGPPSAVHLPSTCGSPVLRPRTANTPLLSALHSPSNRFEEEGGWRATGGLSISSMCDRHRENPDLCGRLPRKQGQESSLGMEFRGIWIFLGRFWRVEGPESGSVKVGGDRGVWGSREDAGGGGYGEKIEGSCDREFGGGTRVARCGDREGGTGVVEGERGDSAGWSEKAVGDCRDSGAGASSRSEEQASEGVETAREKELLRRSRSKHRGGVVRVSGGKLVGGSGQPSPCGRRPEVRLYDSLETCPRPRSFYG